MPVLPTNPRVGCASEKQKIGASTRIPQCRRKYTYTWRKGLASRPFVGVAWAEPEVKVDASNNMIFLVTYVVQYTARSGLGTAAVGVGQPHPRGHRHDTRGSHGAVVS